MHNNLPSNVIRFCPSCGSAGFSQQKDSGFFCEKCNFIFFLNIAAAVAGLIVDDEGRLLLTLRAHAPKKGFLDLPGGFVSFNESAEQALKREIREELGISVTSTSYLVTFPNKYIFSGLEYSTLDLAFSCKTSDLDNIKPDDDVENFIFLHPDEIDMEKIGFESIRNIIKYWIQSVSA